MNKRYFDIKEDIQIINAGGFFCQACLVGKPAQEQSSDPRYCQGCYEFLLKEAEMDTRRGGGDWKPVNPYKKAKNVGEKSAQVSPFMRRIMSTLNDKISEVDIIQLSVAARASGKRGPKHKALPQELIKLWAGEGMGSKSIATKLKAEQGIDVSYKTIQRVLSGQRN